MMRLTTDDYYQRQHRIVHPDLANAHIIIAGLGTLGSWTAQALAHTGAWLFCFDDDHVEKQNVGPQAYLPCDVGIDKVGALLQHMRGFNVMGYSLRFPDDVALDHDPTAVVCCVDSFKSRREIAIWSMEHGLPFIDTRMGGQVGVVWPCTTNTLFEDYLARLPGDDGPPMPCGEAGTAYLGMWVASRVVSILNNYFRNKSCPPHIMWHVGENIDITGREAMPRGLECEISVDSYR